MKNTGERQTAATIDGITPDHRKRYEFAGHRMGMNYGACGIIDAACGVGYGAWMMVLQGHRVTAVDISIEAINFAKQKYNLPNIEYHNMDATAPDPENVLGSGYDFAVSFETIEHVKEPEKLLRNLSSKAHMLIASVPNENVVPFSKETHPFHERHYTPEEFDELLKASGWIPLEWHTQHDKWNGDVSLGNDGRTLIVVAEKAHE